MEIDTDEEFTENELIILGHQYVRLLQIKGFRDFVESNYDIKALIDEENSTIDFEVSVVTFEETARRMAERNKPVEKLFEDNPEVVREIMGHLNNES